jgi:hypothetical protein
MISLVGVPWSVPVSAASPRAAVTAATSTRCAGKLIPLNLPGGTSTSPYAVGTDPAGQACLIQKTARTWRDVPVPRGFTPYILAQNIVYNGENRALVHIKNHWKELFVPGDQGDPNSLVWGYFAAAGSIAVGQMETTSPSYIGPIEAQYDPKGEKFFYLNISAIDEMEEPNTITDNWALGQTPNYYAGGAHWNGKRHRWVPVTFPNTYNDELNATNGQWMGGETTNSGLIFNWNHGRPVRYSVPAGVANITAITDSWALGSSSNGRDFMLLHYGAGKWSLTVGPHLNQYTRLSGNEMTGYTRGPGKGGTVWNATVVRGRWVVGATLRVSRLPAPIAT